MNAEDLVNASIISSEMSMFKKLKLKKQFKLNYSHGFCMTDMHYSS